jgi:hypothetical protein
MKNTSTDDGDKPEKSTSTTIEMDLVIQTILKNHHLVWHAFTTSPHLQVCLISVCQSLYVYDNNSVS